MQSRTHTCGELRKENVGEKVTIVGWMENVREVGGNLAFVVIEMPLIIVEHSYISPFPD